MTSRHTWNSLLACCSADPPALARASEGGWLLLYGQQNAFHAS
jgi:hypothetical protein